MRVRHQKWQTFFQTNRKPHSLSVTYQRSMHILFKSSGHSSSGAAVQRVLTYRSYHKGTPKQTHPVAPPPYLPVHSRNFIPSPERLKTLGIPIRLLRSQSLFLLTSDAVVIAVQLTPVTGLPSIERRHTGIASRLAVAVVDTARVGFRPSRFLTCARRGTASGIFLTRLRCRLRHRRSGNRRRWGGSLSRWHR